MEGVTNPGDMVSLTGGYEVERKLLEEVVLNTDALEQNYTIPKKLKKSKSKQAKEARFEAVDHKQYATKAHCASIKTSQQRILWWLRACEWLYYEKMGSATGFQVNWSENDTNSVKIEVRTSGAEQPEYVLSLFYSTGLLLIQGRQFMKWVNHDLPILKSLVSRLCGSEEEGNGAETDMSSATDTDSEDHDSTKESDTDDVSMSDISEIMMDSSDTTAMKQFAHSEQVYDLNNGSPDSDKAEITMVDMNNGSLEFDEAEDTLVKAGPPTTDSASGDSVPAKPYHSTPLQSTPIHKKDKVTEKKSQPESLILAESMKLIEGTIARAISNSNEGLTTTINDILSKISTLEDKFQNAQVQASLPANGDKVEKLTATVENLHQRLITVEGCPPEMSKQLDKMNNSISNIASELTRSNNKIVERNQEIYAKNIELNNLKMKLDLANEKIEELKLNAQAQAQTAENFSAALYDVRGQLCEKNNLLRSLMASKSELTGRGDTKSDGGGEKPVSSVVNIQARTAAPMPENSDPVEDTNEAPARSVTLVGDSNLQKLKENLMSSNEWSTKKLQATNMKKVERELSQYTCGDSQDLFVIHAGTNDVDNKTAKQFVHDHKTMAQAVRDKYPKASLVISAILPKEGQIDKIKKINSALEMEYEDWANVVFYENKLFRDRQALDKYFEGNDSIHLNAQGIRVFASALKKYIGIGLRSLI